MLTVATMKVVVVACVAVLVLVGVTEARMGGFNLKGKFCDVVINELLL